MSGELIPPVAYGVMVQGTKSWKAPFRYPSNPPAVGWRASVKVIAVTIATEIRTTSLFDVVGLSEITELELCSVWLGNRLMLFPAQGGAKLEG